MAEQNKQSGQTWKQEYKTIGKLFAENIGLGIEEGTEDAVEAADELYQLLLERQQYYLKEKDRIEREIEAAAESKRVGEYAARLQKAKTEEQAEKIRQAERLRLQKQSNSEYLKEVKQSLSAVEKELKTYLKGTEAQLKAQKEKIINSFNEIAGKATDSLRELEKAREKMAEKMSDFGGVFEKKKITFLNSGPNGSKEVFEDTILDLSEERATLETYASLLGEIQARDDIPKELFEAIRELSVEDAIRYQEALLALGDKERTQYLEDWEAIQKLARETADINYAKETEAVLDEVEEELALWFKTVPESFFQEGRLSAEAFGQGFINKLTSMQVLLQSAMESVLTMEAVHQPSEGMSMGESIQQIQNSLTYVLNSAGETVSEQLRSARSHAMVVQLREG